MMNLHIQLNTPKGQKPKLTEVRDFMLIWDESQRVIKENQSPEEMKAIFENMARNLPKKKGRNTKTRKR